MLSTEVQEEDASGRDPLPQYLKRARLGLSRDKAEELKERGNSAEEQGLVSVDPMSDVVRKPSIDSVSQTSSAGHTE
jgi:hypothetical protein